MPRIGSIWRWDCHPDEVMHEYELVTTKKLPLQQFDAVVLGVAHDPFLALDFNGLRKANSILYDVKGVLKENVDGKLRFQNRFPIKIVKNKK